MRTEDRADWTRNRRIGFPGRKRSAPSFTNPNLQGDDAAVAAGRVRLGPDRSAAVGCSSRLFGRCLGFSVNTAAKPMNAQFEGRLAAVGVLSTEVTERFVLGSGRGGQKIQKTSSCVWLRHGPTGVEVRCQDERSQVANRHRAWSELCAKLEERSRVATAKLQDERERVARRHRQKSPRQKARMVDGKKHRSGIKQTRGRIWSD